MKIINIILPVFLLTSCTVIRNNFDSNYKGEKNYKNFYIVDTIKIEDPIIVDYHGGKFISPRMLFKNTKHISTFFKRQDVFLLGSDFYYDLSPKDYKKYSYPDYGNCNETKSIHIFNNKQIIIYEYINKPVYFILCLINTNYYNVKHGTIDGEYYQIKNNDQKNSYYKIVYPICK